MWRHVTGITNPNAAARALVGRRTRVVKLTIFEDMDTTEPLLHDAAAGIMNANNQHQYAFANCDAQ